jgi:hypothetical protein
MVKIGPSLIGFHPMNELYETRGQNANRKLINHGQIGPRPNRVSSNE